MDRLALCRPKGTKAKFVLFLLILTLPHPSVFVANELFGGKNYTKAIGRYIKALGHTG